MIVTLDLKKFQPFQKKKKKKKKIINDCNFRS